jgi:hypothetical protein
LESGFIALMALTSKKEEALISYTWRLSEGFARSSRLAARYYNTALRKSRLFTQECGAMKAVMEMMDAAGGIWAAARFYDSGQRDDNVAGGCEEAP